MSIGPEEILAFSGCLHKKVETDPWRNKSEFALNFDKAVSSESKLSRLKEKSLPK
jgi:hypothetical protein